MHRRQYESSHNDHGVADSANRFSPRRDAQNRIHLHPEKIGEKSEAAKEERGSASCAQTTEHSPAQSNQKGAVEAMETLAQTCGSQNLQSAGLP